jgi:hypothetical protein
MRLAKTLAILSVATPSAATVPQSGPAHVIRDINRSVGPETTSSPKGFVEVGDVALFIATTL